MFVVPWFHSMAGEVVGLLSEYLRSELPLDVEGLRRGATGLRHLHHTLGTACQGLNRWVSPCYYCYYSLNDLRHLVFVM